MPIEVDVKDMTFNILVSQHPLSPVAEWYNDHTL